MSVSVVPFFNHNDKLLYTRMYMVYVSVIFELVHRRTHNSTNDEESLGPKDCSFATSFYLIFYRCADQRGLNESQSNSLTSPRIILIIILRIVVLCDTNYWLLLSQVVEDLKCTISSSRTL